MHKMWRVSLTVHRVDQKTMVFKAFFRPGVLHKLSHYKEVSVFFQIPNLMVKEAFLTALH